MSGLEGVIRIRLSTCGLLSLIHRPSSIRNIIDIAKNNLGHGTSDSQKVTRREKGGNRSLLRSLVSAGAIGVFSRKGSPFGGMSYVNFFLPFDSQTDHVSQHPDLCLNHIRHHPRLPQYYFGCNILIVPTTSKP